MADSRYGDRDRSAHRRSDSIFGDDDDRGEDRRGRGPEGGFFQRAGEAVSSWFGDDDDRGQSRSQGSRSDYGAYRSGRSSADGLETWGGGSDWSGGRGASQGSGGSSTFDDHYMSWRERQIRQLDQDYEDYCRDRQKQFETDFHGWRQGPQNQSAGQSGAAAATAGRMAGDQESSAATTAGGGGEASATQSSTGSSATTASGARTGRKSQEK